MKSEKEVKTFNSADIVSDLEKAGMDRQLAQAVVRALHASMDYVLSQTVTRAEFAEFKASMHKDMSDFKGEVRAEMQKQLRIHTVATITAMAALMAFFS